MPIKRCQGLPPSLFWICWEKVVGDYVHRMPLDDMDEPAMRQVYNLIRTRQGPAIDRFIARYNETYFRELVWTLEKRARQMMMDPDVLRKLTTPCPRPGSARPPPTKCPQAPYKKFWIRGTNR